jgi:hypothetical protein
VQERHSFAYRINHPLGENVIDSAKSKRTSLALVVFDYSNHQIKISIAEQLKSQSD